MTTATCPACSRPMGDTTCDALGWRQPDGVTFPRIRNEGPRCTDCGCPAGAWHHADCDQDRCPHEAAAAAAEQWAPDCGCELDLEAVPS